MTAVGWLPATAEELFGQDATAEESYEVLTVDVPPAAWITALETARDRLGCTYFDWLSAVDEPGTGFRVTAHIAALTPVRRLLLRTTVPHEAPTLPSAVGVYAGAAWHERETYEMFGVTFEGHPALDHLLLPENFEGHPLRKDFVLAARVAKAWPGAKEPGESEHGGPKRRQMLPPGVPDPNEWGPLKGQLPPAPPRGAGRAAGERPARGAARPAGERPVRRTRSVSEGSASQSAAAAQTPAAGAEASAAGAEVSAAGGRGQGAGAARSEAPPRRARTAAEGSAGQSAPDESAARPSSQPRRNRSATQGSASQQPDRPTSTPDPASPTPDPAAPAPDPASSSSPRSSDAPWHHARPAFDEPAPEPSPEAAQLPAPESAGGPQPSGPPDSPQTSDTPGPATQPTPSDDTAKRTDGPDNPDSPENREHHANPGKPEQSKNPENPENAEKPEDSAGGPQ
ncbi:NADH-quinone oxidoreductase subunit C [Streptomyces tibetensis]|uniref:NADH-quinone oxidoreductase subunit C n=1 Tax=Streptomyces tibetensis TaxID=2382123 RepID=UPI0033C314F1